MDHSSKPLTSNYAKTKSYKSYKTMSQNLDIKNIHGIIEKLNEQFDLKITDFDSVTEKYKSIKPDRIYRAQTKIYMLYINTYYLLNKPITIKDYCLCFGLHIGLFTTLAHKHGAESIFTHKCTESTFLQTYTESELREIFQLPLMRITSETEDMQFDIEI